MTEQTPTKLLNKGFISITVINFIVYLVYYLLMVIIAVIAQDSLHATLGQAGLASGIYIIGTLLARLFMGKLLELIGRKQVLRYGALFYLLTTVAYMYMPSMGIPLSGPFFKWVWLRNRFDSDQRDCHRLYP
ncbi:MFS transporter [Enterococcus faecalis TX0630]|uniref:MFS transporter n=1 Tax=Enterococcus faecalis TX0630 TaxID=749508 RepID=A0ABC9PAD8_ENTFL|nr:MFS transporter [Enterococcus faecalis TX0630]